MVILAIVKENGREILAGIGQFIKEEKSQMAEAAFAVRDDFQNRGIGTELLSYIAVLAKREGLHGFTAEVLIENRPMLHVFERVFPDLEKRVEEGIYDLVMRFGDKNE
jgi:GNAT superfamily N-acetyltransferase